MAELPVMKIFLSSPGDVAEERALAEIVFRRLADEFADTVTLKLVIWEHEPVYGHTGYQQQIERTKDCDLVISILWSRLGTRLPSDFALIPGQPAPTGTEFEINDALAAHAVHGKPKLLIYRRVPGPQVGLGSADFGERSDQYQRLDEFCQRKFYEDGVLVVSHRTFNDSHSFERYLSDHVRTWLSDQVLSRHPEGFRPIWRGQSPFRGLQSFEAAHQAIFFGRSEAIGDLIRRIREAEIAARNNSFEKLLLVQGMSGAGKTSLFKAGLLPFLELRPIEGIARWTTIVIRPSESDPTMVNFGALGVLAARLCEAVPTIERLGTTRQTLAQTLFDRPVEAAAKIEICVAADADNAGIAVQRVRLLIYVDQLEEAFALPDSSAVAGPLLASMVALARVNSIWIMATIRSDFVHRLEVYSELMMSLGRSPPYTLLPPRSDELAEMIREPAKAAGLIWEQRDGVSLDQELLRDATGNAESLPLLEYTLAELYERRKDRLLRWSDYGGGLRGALISAADEVLRGASGDVEAAFRDVMRELVGVGEDGVATRRYASLARFPHGSSARGLLDRLILRRLCVTNDEGHGQGPVAYLAHEALIKSWPRAQDWLQRETKLLRMRDEVARDAAVWEFHKRADDWLGVEPEKLAAIDQIEQADLIPGGAAIEYASGSRRRARRNTFLKRAAITGISGFALLASALWIVAVNERNKARSATAAASAAAITADSSTQFMVKLFQSANPTENRGKTITVEEVLKKGADEISKSNTGNGLKREPRVRSALLTAMGQAYTGLGLYKPAETLLEQARMEQVSSSIQDESRVRTLVASGVALYLDGQYEEAEKPLRDSVDLARKILLSSNILRSQSLTGLADVLVQLGNDTEAEQLCSEALIADRKRGPEDTAILANTLASLGGALFYAGNLAAAEAPMRESLKLREEALGTDHALTAESLNNLGALLYESGRFDAAMNEYRRALPIERQVFGDSHPEVATTLSNIGRSALMAGGIDEAEPLLREARDMTEKFQGDSHDFLVSPLNSLAMIDVYRGNLNRAREEIKRAKSIAILPDHGGLLDQVLLNEADIEYLSGHREQASLALSQSMESLKKAHPRDAASAWRYAVWDTVNAELLANSGDPAGAARILSAAQAVILQRFGANGFYSLVAKRRALLIASASQH